MATRVDFAEMELDSRLAAARSGDAEALFDLGMMYCIGDGVDVDLIEAHKWFNLAVMRGFDDAKDNRADVAAEMSAAEIATAQRRARDFLATCH
jgi:uncharacterized protein